MIDSPGDYDPVRETEALIRSAAEYVRISPDLHPRVVEAARLNRREFRARRIIRHTAIAVAVLAWSVITIIGRMNGTYMNQQLPITATGAFSISGRVANSGGEDWTLVNAFTELRDKQADVLRF